MNHCFNCEPSTISHELREKLVWNCQNHPVGNNANPLKIFEPSENPMKEKKVAEWNYIQGCSLSHHLWYDVKLELEDENAGVTSVGEKLKRLVKRAEMQLARNKKRSRNSTDP